MAQPIQETTYDPNSVVLSEWRVDGKGTLAEGTYVAGSVLGLNVAGTALELTADAAKVDLILLEDTTVEAGTTKIVPVLEGGEVAEQDLVLGGTLTIADVRANLRDKNIYIKKRG